MLSGLTRVRQFSQDDAHCFVTEEQIASEVEALLKLVQRVYGDFDLTFEAKLSTRPPEFLGEIATWDRAEAGLKQALDAAAQPYTINDGDGAFYGPKIDFDITDAIGRKWQCATIQLDYQMPARFKLTYVGADNAEHTPGRHPPGDFRQLRAVHRAADRALRGGLPALAGAGAGDDPADRGPPSRVRPRGAPAAGGRPGCGSRSTSARKRSDIRSAGPSCTRFRTCW